MGIEEQVMDGRAPGASSPELAAALADPAAVERVMRSFVEPDGRLRALPAKHSRRLVLLDRIAALFEPGVRYPEPEVNAMLRALFDDVAALRRYLVDEGFLDRAGGLYWRTGGSVDLPGAPAAPPAQAEQ